MSQCFFFFIVFSSRHLLCLLLCFVSWESKRLWASGFELFASGVEFVLWKAVCLLRLLNLSCALKFAPPRDIYMSKKNQQNYNSFRMSPTCLLKQIKSFSWRWQHEAGQHCGSSPFFFHLSQQRLSGGAGWAGIILTHLLCNNSTKGGCRWMLSAKSFSILSYATCSAADRPAAERGVRYFPQVKGKKKNSLKGNRSMCKRAMVCPRGGGRIQIHTEEILCNQSCTENVME